MVRPISEAMQGALYKTDQVSTCSPLKHHEKSWPSLTWLKGARYVSKVCFLFDTRGMKGKSQKEEDKERGLIDEDHTRVITKKGVEVVCV